MPRRSVTTWGLLLLPFVVLPAAASWPSAAPAQTAVRNPHGPIALSCESCHTSTSWRPIRKTPDFNHNKTSYPLLGMHQKVDCVDCHTSLVFSDVSTRCAACHADIHRGQFGASCDRCHTVRGWDVSARTTETHQNRFPLVLAHAALDCESCHKGAAVGQFQGLSTQCYSCHAKDFQTTTNPSHVGGRFSTSCEQCHSMSSWVDAKFDHALTGFPLSGSHAAVACVACHVNNNFRLTGADVACVSCHMRDYQATANPNHVSQRYPTTCEQCHNVTSWQGAVSDHSLTGFPLTGAHSGVACEACHVSNNFHLTSANAVCSACHMRDYQSATSPNHAAGHFPTDCASCHSTSAWAGAAFNHATTGWALTGAHTGAACTSCHVNSNYGLTAANTNCATCHMPDYQSATSPNHAAGHFPTDCASCHSTATWTNGGFNHATTGWALTGAHTAAACTSCHVNSNYALTAANTGCSACHMPDYQSAANPNHAAGHFPTDCSVCHSTATWTNGGFNHATTGWALTGAHAGTACTSCHSGNNYNLTSANTACVACHQSTYNTAVSPVNHAQLGFPTTCEVCHDTTLWTNAAFNHNATPFPLTGAHATVVCASCHVNSNYTSVPTDCYSCHKTDYQNAVPNHASAGFPTTCQTCHTTTGWAGATFNHTWFPTNHGNAQGVCATCHTNSADYAVFQCTGCHTASKTTPEHSGVSGYVFNNTNCYQCHPRGSGD